MSFRLRFLVILFCLFFEVASCEKPPITPQIPTVPEDKIEIYSSLNQELPPEGGSNQVSFSSSGPWTAQFISSSPNDWCAADPLSGAKETKFINLYAGENDTDATRTAILRISSGNECAEVTISQYYVEHLTIFPNEFIIGPESQSIKVSVTSNVSVGIDVPQSCTWVRYSSDPSSSIYTLIIEENRSSELRTAEIWFYGGKTQLSQKLNIIQNKNEDSNPGIHCDIEIPGFEDNDW